MNLEPTCIKKECHLWKKYKTNCPNYYMTSWKNPESNQAYTLDDCSPKRTMLMFQELFSRFIGVQKSNEQQRNKTNDFLKLFQTALEMSKEGQNGLIR